MVGESSIKKTMAFAAIAFLVLMPLFAIAPTANSAITTASHAPRIRAGDTNDYSTNWGGYAVTAAAGTVNDVKGSWIVPATTCPSTQAQYSSHWIGIDGFSSNTVEQIGTDSDCNNGAPTYYAWYEFYPHPSYLISGMTITPGDTMTSEVKYLGSGKFSVSLTDVNTGASFTTTSVVKKAQRSSAEWIVEAPWGITGLLPLANFGTASYGFDYTTTPSTDYATIGSTTGAIGSFGNAIQQITMVTKHGAMKAQPSNLTTDGTSFTATWYSTGP